MLYVFFFKQKSAYGMRISDWSADVCSSDLELDGFSRGGIDEIEFVACEVAVGRAAREIFGCVQRLVDVSDNMKDPAIGHRPFGRRGSRVAGHGDAQCQCLRRVPARHIGRAFGGRSEEHTSELQSLMRISYAVFCLKKKIKKKQTPDLPYHR